MLWKVMGLLFHFIKPNISYKTYDKHLRKLRIVVIYYKIVATNYGIVAVCYDIATDVAGVYEPS